MKEAGYAVSIICPQGKGYNKSYEVIADVSIYRHPLREARSTIGFVREYFVALTYQLYLSFRIQRRRRIHVVQACNPPDLMFLVALVHKLLFGTHFVFDHHDLSPELYVVKFGRKDFFYKALCLFERLTFRFADASIATNEVFRDIAVERGGMHPDNVAVVKSYPERTKFQRTVADQTLMSLKKNLIGYIGIMGAQDGVEMLVRAMAEIRHVRKRHDVACVVIGDGPELARLKELAVALDVDQSVHFTGYLSGPSLMAHLSAIEVGVIPDPPNDFNDKLSMNKVFEYMMLGLPFVQFNLGQAAREAGEAALVLLDHSPEALADAALTLVDDPERRKQMGQAGRVIADRDFHWRTEARQFLAVYRNLLGEGREVNDQRDYSTPRSTGSPEKVPGIAWYTRKPRPAKIGPAS